TLRAEPRTVGIAASQQAEPLGTLSPLDLHLTDKAQPVDKAGTAGFAQERATFLYQRVKARIVAILAGDMSQTQERQAHRFSGAKVAQNAQALLLEVACRFTV